jgi:hypothetical protein
MPRASNTSSFCRWFAIAQAEPVLGRPKPDPWDPTAERIEHDGQIEETGGGRLSREADQARCRQPRVDSA